MRTGLIKDNRYEIVAILRDAMRKKTTLEMHFERGVFNTHIQMLDNNYIYINSAESLSYEMVSVTLKDIDGVIIFDTLIAEKIFSGTDCYFRLVLPSVLQIIQRRSSRRILTNKDQNFKCYGRFRNGESYVFDIVNISTGGCALSTPQPNVKFLTKGGGLKNARMLFGALGEVYVDLLVLNSAFKVDCDKYENCIYQFPCRFNFKSVTEMKFIENVIMDVTLKNKRRKDTFNDIYFQFPERNIKR